MRSVVKYPALLAALIAVLSLGDSAQLRAQSITIYPTVLYPGLNLVTIRARQGLARIQRRHNGAWQSILSGQETPNMRVVTGPIFTSCATSATMMIQVNTISQQVRLGFRVEDCEGDDRDFILELGEVWNVTREEFGIMEVGQTVCRKFQVATQRAGTNYQVDSVRSPSRSFTIRYTEGRPPVLVRAGGTYFYDVCFTATRPGVIAMPINVYLRRSQPVGAHTNFIVADTAYVQVIPSARPIRPVPAPPRISPRPSLPDPPVIVIDTVVRVGDVDTVSVRAGGLVPPDSVEASVAGVRVDIAEGPPPELLDDPTPFRIGLGPNARSIGDGKGFVANYDIFGWLFGFGPTDRLSLLGGVLYVPEFIGYSLTMTAGGRYEFYRDGITRVAAGAQFNYSRTDLSTIALAAPYVTASVGDDGARATVTLGYSWRRHTPVAEAPFNRSALLMGGGGDYRFADHWKATFEAYYIRNSDVEPVSVGLRYFTHDYAIDAGLGINVGGKGGSVSVGPVVSYMYTW